MDAQGHRQQLGRSRGRALLYAALLAACGGSRTAPPAEPPRATAAETRAGVTFLHDDYPRALAKARAERKLLFVDAWAPWCHSCLSMKAYTLRAPELATLERDFVFLEIDTEQPANAAFVEKHTNRVWPTLYVIDPDGERARLVWPGTATAPELAALLADTRAAVRDAREDSPHAALLRASTLVQEEKFDDALATYRPLLGHASPAIRARASEAMTTLLSSRDRHAECVDVASRAPETLPRGSSLATAIVNGLSCAAEDAALDATRLVDAARVILDAPGTRGALLADDRSGIYEALVELQGKRKRPAERLETARAWARFLDAEAQAARTPEERIVFDWHRVLAYEATGEAARAIPMLEASARDFPRDYSPWARLARVHLARGHLAEAHRAIDLAAERVYGPRTLRVAAVAADIAEAEKDPARARALLEKAIRAAEPMPLSPAQKKLVRDLVKRVERLSLTTK